jgi:hypothetical protein
MPRPDDALAARWDGHLDTNQGGPMTAIHATATDHEPAVQPRISGWGARAAIAAPVVALFSFVVGAPLYADDLSEAAATGRFVVASAGALVVLLLLAAALVTFYIRFAERLSTLGQTGFVVALAGTVLAAGGAWDSLFTLPYLADEAPAVLDVETSGSLLVGFVISYVVLVVGWAMFAAATLRARVAPRGAAITLLVSSIVAIMPAPTPLRLLPLAVGAALVGRAVLRSRA